MQDDSPNVDSAPLKGFTVHIEHAALWSSLVFGGVIYRLGLWWFEDERPRRRAAERADP